MARTPRRRENARHCERSEAIQRCGEGLDCFVAELVIGPATSGRTRWLLAMTKAPGEPEYSGTAALVCRFAVFLSASRNLQEETMFRRHTLAAAAALAALTGNTAFADPLPSETHKVLTAALAVEAAQAAIAACKAQGYNVTVTIADRTGTPILLLVGDGAGGVTREVTRRKAYTAAQRKMTTGEYAKRFPTPSGFDPGVYDRDLAGGPGGVPIKVGDDTIGGIAAAGAPGGDLDEGCALAGLNKISDRLN
jgi:uncharacterized protein GlcG (DUF336 family)